MRHYNEVRLHSAIGYVTPADKMAGNETAIFAERDRRLEAARKRRRAARDGKAGRLRPRGAASSLESAERAGSIRV